MTEEKYINGSVYEDWYADIDSEYFGLYVANGIPPQAISQNQYLADLAIAVLNLEPGARILDAGCGIGHSMRPFLRRGFRVHGIEVSKSARLYSPYRDLITVGNIMEMPFADKEFDLVFSHGTMEHIHEDLVDKTVAELHRVGLRQFHIISVDEESPKKDPGHITIRPMKWWMEKFVNKSDKYYMSGILPEFLIGDEREPIIFGVPAALSTIPVRMFFQRCGTVKKSTP